MRALRRRALVRPCAGPARRLVCRLASRSSASPRERSDAPRRTPRGGCVSTSAADYLVDRRRLRRQLGVWRIVAFVAAALAIIALGARLFRRRGRRRRSAHRPPHDLRLHRRQRRNAEADPRGARFAEGRRSAGPHRQPRRRHRGFGRDLRRIASIGGEKTGGGGGRRHGGVRRLYRRARRRSHFRPRQFNRRLDRRADRISQRFGADGQGRGQSSNRSSRRR